MSDEVVKLTVGAGTPALRARVTTPAVQLISRAPRCSLSARSVSVSVGAFAEAS